MDNETYPRPGTLLLSSFTCDDLTAFIQLALERSCLLPNPIVEGAELEKPIDLKEACDFLKLKENTIRGKIYSKTIPFHKRSRRLYFYRSELNRWIKGEIY